jgi:hypothetical protein
MASSNKDTYSDIQVHIFFQVKTMLIVSRKPRVV